MPTGWFPEPDGRIPGGRHPSGRPSVADALGTVLILVDQLDHCITPKGATRTERILARLHGTRLDRDLVAGASPEASAELALRGQLLVRPSERRALARSVLRLLAEAERSAPRLFRSGSPIRRDRVRAAAAEFQSLVDHLLAPAPVSARGVAHVTVLLSDGSGPLYHPGSSEDLRSHVLQAINALNPLHDWWVS
jgi:hypothetical protein